MLIKYKSLEGSYHLLNERQFALVYLLDKYAIKQHRIVNLYYESDSGKYWRKVEPYIVGIKDKGKGNFFFTGYFLPTKKQLSEGNKPKQKTFLIDKIDIKKFEISNNKFYKLQVPAERIYHTPSIVVLSRVSF